MAKEIPLKGQETPAKDQPNEPEKLIDVLSTAVEVSERMEKEEGTFAERWGKVAQDYPHYAEIAAVRVVFEDGSVLLVHPEDPGIMPPPESITPSHWVGTRLFTRGKG